MTRADVVSAARDEDTQLIEQLRRALATVTAERDDFRTRAFEAERSLARIANALGLPIGTGAGRVIDEIWRLR